MIDSDVGNAFVAGPTCASPPFSAICVAPWICAVAPKLTGEPVRPVLDAVAVWAPALAPRVQILIAMPSASVSRRAAYCRPRRTQGPALSWPPATRRTDEPGPWCTSVTEGKRVNDIHHDSHCVA